MNNLRATLTHVLQVSDPSKVDAAIALLEESEKTPAEVEKERKQFYEARRVRGGKTQRDRQSHAKDRNRNNKALRGAYTNWCMSSDSQKVSTAQAMAKFPLDACNGKKSRRLKAKAGRIINKKAA